MYYVFTSLTPSDAFEKNQIPVCLVTTKNDLPDRTHSGVCISGYEQISTSTLAHDSQKKSVAAILSMIARRNGWSQKRLHTLSFLIYRQPLPFYETWWGSEMAPSACKGSGCCTTFRFSYLPAPSTGCVFEPGSPRVLPHGIRLLANLFHSFRRRQFARYSVFI